MNKSFKSGLWDQDGSWPPEARSAVSAGDLAAVIKDMALETWAELPDDEDFKVPGAKYKTNLACQLAGLCIECGDSESAQSLLFWSQVATTRVFGEKGCRLSNCDDRVMAEKAYKMGTGARVLKTVMEGVVGPLMFEHFGGR